jgi:UDP:flavonoid glycosyltransferase YjiC (YdhE family)
MKFALFTYGTHGDVYPFLALGRELAGQGHDAVLVAPPQYADAARDQDLAFTPLCPAGLLDDFIRSPSAWDVARGSNSFFSDLILPFVDPVFAAVRGMDLGQTCVLASVLALGARIAREVSPFRLVTLCPYPVFFSSRIGPPALPRIDFAGLGTSWWSRPLFRMLGGLDRLFMGAPRDNPRSYVGVRRSAFRKRLFGEAFVRISDVQCAAPLNRYRLAMGLPERRRYFEDYLFSPDLVVGLFPDWFAPRQADWPKNTVLTSFPLLVRPHQSPSAAFRRFVAATDEAPILFTFGSQKQGNRRLFELAARASSELGLPAIFLSRNADDILPGLPPRTIHLGYEPLPDILPHVRLIVHHAGIGTSADALRAGTPQILLPFCYDQPDNATRLQRLGVGRMLSAGSLTVAGLKEAISHVLGTPGYQDRTRHYAQAMADTGRAFPASKAILEWLGQGARRPKKLPV